MRFLHAIIQHYYVDGQDGVLTPVGMLGTKLEADYHIVHGIRTRVQNTIRCIKEIPLEVEDVVLNSLASAQVVVSQNQKNLGVLVIDMGGGTIDYLVYVDGAIKQSGVIPVGGDHITNDVSLGLRIPAGRAERLKIDEGSAILGNCLPGETLHLPPEPGFAGREIERETLDAELTYWPFAARAEAQGMRSVLDMSDTLVALGAPKSTPMLGFVFSAQWAATNQRSLLGFLGAARRAQAILANSDAEWDLIAPLTGTHDAAELTHLRDWYRRGVIGLNNAGTSDAAARLYAQFASIGGADLVGPSPTLAPGTFWSSP